MRAWQGCLAVSVTVLGVGVSAHAAEFSSAEICKATIAVEMARSPKYMKTDRPGDTPQISFRREDGDLFRYRCRLEGARVIWSSYLSDEKVWGRWRTAYGDGDVPSRYSIANGTLTIDNERAGSQHFVRADFTVK